MLVATDAQNLQGPQLKKPLKDETVTNGQNVVLEATFIANPVPEATW